MHTYRLIFSDDEFGVARTVEFDAADTGQALAFAYQQARGRSAELWNDRRRLRSIRGSARQQEVLVSDFSFA